MKTRAGAKRPRNRSRIAAEAVKPPLPPPPAAQSAPAAPAVPTSRWPAVTEIGLTALFLALLAAQVLLQPIVGMANNGDFAKVTYYFCYGPPSGGGQEFVYVLPHYVRSDRYCTDFGVRGYSELGLTAVALALSKLAGSGALFDIRAIGALHTALLTLAFYCFVRVLRPLGWRVQLLGGLIAAWIFSDPFYATHLNSFYMDTPAMIGLLGAVPLAWVLLATPRAPFWVVAVFTGWVLLFALSKSQHAVYGWLGVLVIAAWARRETPRRRIGAGVLAVSIIAASAMTVAATAEWYKSQAVFNVVFHKVLPRDPDAARFFGIRDEEKAYIGKHSFMIETASPAVSFYGRINAEAILRYYVHNPSLAFWSLARDLRESRSIRFPVGNYRKSDGRPPGARYERPPSWIRFREAAIRWWPWHLLLWYLAVVAVASWQRSWILLALAAVAVAQFLIASLLDDLETPRHLMMFHVITDITVVYVIVAALSATTRLHVSPRFRALAVSQH
jgi:hypothetical protein